MFLRLVGTALAATLLVLTAPLSSAAEPARTDLALRPPTGPHLVDTDALHLRNDSRPNPWVGSQLRDLMVSV